MKILTKRKPSIIFSVSGLIAGIYAGFMVWYALKTYIPGPLHTHLSYLAVIVLGISAFIAVYQIPDLLFANEKIEHVLPLPIDSGTVIFVLLKKVICLQAELCIAVYWAGFLFCFRNALAVSFAVLYCLIMLVSLMILFSIHNLDLVSNFCDRIIFLDKNRKISMTDNAKNFEELEKLFFEKCVE